MMSNHMLSNQAVSDSESEGNEELTSKSFVPVLGLLDVSLRQVAATLGIVVG